VLFREGDAASDVYVVEAGWLNVTRSGRAGQRELTLHVSGPRQVIAGVGAFVHGAALGSSCTALEDASVLVLPAGVVRRVVFHSPLLAEAVLSHFARRHAELLERFDHFVFTDLNARLAAYLLEHAGDAGFALPTNTELASRLGTVPELVSRKLGEFYRQGFIALRKRVVSVEDEEALRSLVNAQR